MADLPATASSNLPTQRKAPEFPVDREKLEKQSGRPAGSGYQAGIENVKKLIRAVKAGYAKLTIDEGVQKPTTDQVFKANEAEITFRLSNVLGDSKLFDSQSLPLPLVNSENNLLWPFVVEMTKNPTKYGVNGLPGVQKHKPIGRDSQLAAPKK